MSTLRKINSADEDDNDHGNGSDRDLFYNAVALTYDQSPVVREYFHNDRSRTRPDNKSLAITLPGVQRTGA